MKNNITIGSIITTQKYDQHEVDIEIDNVKNIEDIGFNKCICAISIKSNDKDLINKLESCIKREVNKINKLKK